MEAEVIGTFSVAEASRDSSSGLSPGFGSGIQDGVQRAGSTSGMAVSSR